jgi:hypothetical protein
MRFEKEKCQAVGIEVSSACNRRERGRFGHCLALIGRDQVTARTPSPGQLLAVVDVRSKSSGCIKHSYRDYKGAEYRTYIHFGS